jgi:AcrR family transcriptional regulator
LPKPTWFNLPPDKRRRVLDAAMVEFGARGFSAGSLNVIAREAGVAKGSLFQYFADKLDVFAHVCDECSARVRDHMVAALDTRPDDEQLFDTMRWAALEFVTYFADHPLERGVTFASNFEIDAATRATVRRVTNRHYLDVLQPMVKLAADRGELRPDADHDQLLALLMLLLPHLALAPHAPELDPVLGLHGARGPALAGPVTGLIDTLEFAFGTKGTR